MVKRLCVAAMAATAVSSFAQQTEPIVPTPTITVPVETTITYSPSPSTSFGFYENDCDILSAPPAYNQSVSYSDMERNVRHQAKWLNATDRFDFEDMLSKEDGNIAYIITKAMYDARVQANIARHDVVAQVVNSYEQMANSNTPMTYAMSDFSDVQSKPLRFAFAKPSNPQLTWDDARDIISGFLTTSENAAFGDWWRFQAEDRQKDVLVHMLEKDAWTLSVPVYASTLTTRAW